MRDVMFGQHVHYNAHMHESVKHFRALSAVLANGPRCGMCTKMHSPLSAQIRQMVGRAMESASVGARQFEETHGLKRWALRGFLDPKRQQEPGVDRAQEICDALGLELRIVPKGTNGGFAEGVTAYASTGPSGPTTEMMPLRWHNLADRPVPVPIMMSATWASSHDLVPANLRAVLVDKPRLGQNGREMIVIVDVEAQRAGAPAAWALAYEGRTWAATVEFQRRVWVIHRMHDDGSSLALTEDERDRINILGRIRWLSVLD